MKKGHSGCSSCRHSGCSSCFRGNGLLLMCWVIVTWTLEYILQWNSSWNTKISIQVIHLKMSSVKWQLFCSSRDHFVYAPSQWQMTLHCNVVSHWLGAYTKWSLFQPPWDNPIPCSVAGYLAALQPISRRFWLMMGWRPWESSWNMKTRMCPALRYAGLLISQKRKWLAKLLQRNWWPWVIGSDS